MLSKVEAAVQVPKRFRGRRSVSNPQMIQREWSGWRPLGYSFSTSATFPLSYRYVESND